MTIQNNQQDLSQKFINSPHGKSLGEAACVDIFKLGRTLHYHRGRIIFQESEPAAGLFLLLSGLVKLTRFTAGGREVIIHHVNDNSFFAEAALFLGKYPATAVAVEDVAVIMIPKEELYDLMNRHRTLLTRVFETMAEWLKLFVNKIDQLTLNDATARVVRYLLELRSEQHIIGHPEEILLPIKKGDLAVMLNINAATLSRTLRFLQNQGILEVEARKFVIKDVSALTELANPPLE